MDEYKWALNIIVGRRKVIVVQTSGHCRVEGNEKTDELANLGPPDYESLKV